MSPAGTASDEGPKYRRASQIQWTFRFLECRARDGLGVDHRRLDIAVPQQVLDRADIVAGLQQMAGEAVTERVRRDTFCDSGCGRCFFDCSLDIVRIHMEPPEFLCLWHERQRRGGKKPLPGELLGCAFDLALELAG